MLNLANWKELLAKLLSLVQMLSSMTIT
jgi:hypothetical protein